MKCSICKRDITEHMPYVSLSFHLPRQYQFDRVSAPFCLQCFLDREVRASDKLIVHLPYGNRILRSVNA